MSFRREDGATAIFVSLLAILVLLPLVGFATSAVVRGGVQAELNMATDAGALAGAATVALGDFDDLQAFIDSRNQTVTVVDDPTVGDPVHVEPVPLPQVPPALQPLAIACNQAMETLGANGLLGDENTTRPGDRDVICEAEYLDIDIFLDEFGDCFDKLKGPDPDYPPELAGVVPTPAQLRDSLRNTLPGLLVPGVQVTLMRNVVGPFEALINAGPGSGPIGDHLAQSRARRHFKNVIVAPVVIVPDIPSIPNPLPDPVITDPITGEPIDNPLPPVADPNDELPDEVDLNDQLSQQEALDLYDDSVQGIQDLDDAIDQTPAGPIDLIPPECDSVFPALRDDFVDLFNPPEEGATTSQDIIDAAATNDETVIILVLTSGIPFFDFLPACVEQDPSGDTTAFLGCTTNAGGAFRASLLP